MQSLTTRTRIFESPLGSVDHLECVNRDRRKSPEGFSPEFQICLPYDGLFVWHVGNDDVVAEANQVLFVSGGEAFQVSQPIGGRYRELIITPAVSILAELAQTTDTRLSTHPLFAGRSHHAHPRLQQLRARLQYCTASGEGDGLAADELVAQLLCCAFQIKARAASTGPATRRLIRRTKLYLEAFVSHPLRLHDISRAVDASPAYLTDAFRRVEGVPLHKYLVQLRLAKALTELPHRNDLTALALDLGFSSHSHFAASFRRAFGSTPSAFRHIAGGIGPKRQKLDSRPARGRPTVSSQNNGLVESSPRTT
jgi:AraC family transcriptional regulator